MTEEEPELPNIRDMIKALAFDLITLENPEIELSLNDLREEIANIVVNQMMILNFLSINSNIKNDIPKGLYS